MRSVDPRRSSSPARLHIVTDQRARSVAGRASGYPATLMSFGPAHWQVVRPRCLDYVEPCVTFVVAHSVVAIEASSGSWRARQPSICVRLNRIASGAGRDSARCSPLRDVRRGRHDCARRRLRPSHAYPCVSEPVPEHSARNMHRMHGDGSSLDRRQRHLPSPDIERRISSRRLRGWISSRRLRGWISSRRLRGWICRPASGWALEVAHRRLERRAGEDSPSLVWWSGRAWKLGGGVHLGHREAGSAYARNTGSPAFVFFG
jgi:hypothetical protein